MTKRTARSVMPSWEVTEEDLQPRDLPVPPRRAWSWRTTLLMGCLACLAAGGAYWHVPGWSQPPVLPEHLEVGEQRRRDVRALAYHPNGDLIAAGRQDGTLSVYDLAEEASSFVLEGQQQGIRCLAFSSDGDHLAVASVDSGMQSGALYVWSPAARKIVAVLGPFSSPVSCVAFQPRGRLLAVGTANGSLQLIATDSWHVLYQVRAHSDEVLSLDFAQDGQQLVTGSSDQAIKLWHVPGLQEVTSLFPRLGAVRSVAFSPVSDTVAAVGGESPELITWHLGSGRVRRTQVGGEGLRMVAFHPRGQSLVVASGTWPRSGALRPFTADLQLQSQWPPSAQIVYCATFSPDGGSVASGDTNGSIVVRDAFSGATMRVLR